MQFKGGKGHKVYLMNIWGSKMNHSGVNPVDSIIPIADTFSFKGTFTEYNYYSISIDSLSKYKLLIIDTGLIVVKGHVDSIYEAHTAQSFQNNLFRSFNRMYNPLIAASNILARERKPQDSIIKVMQDSIIEFAQLHPNSYAAFLRAESLFKMGYPREEAKKIGQNVLNVFADEIKGSAKGKQMAYLLYKYDTSKIIGFNFPTVSLYDSSRKKSLLKLDKNKIYFIDYWASWCIPCIEKLPSLKELYRKYRSENFEIISLSFDLNYEAWIKAIKKQQIPWQNYASLKGDEAEDVKYFNINAIPYTILVGKDNKIIKLNPTEEEVEEYLKKNKTN